MHLFRYVVSFVQFYQRYVSRLVSDRFSPAIMGFHGTFSNNNATKKAILQSGQRISYLFYTRKRIAPNQNSSLSPNCIWREEFRVGAIGVPTFETSLPVPSKTTSV